MRDHQDKAKILYIVNHFKIHGGIERMLSNKIDAWIDNYGYEILVITVYQEGLPVVYPTKNKFKLIDLNLKNINKPNPKRILKFINMVKEIIKREAPDLVITTLTGIPSLIVPLISRKTKSILEIHSSGALSVTANWKYKWNFLRRYHKVIVLNEDEKRYYKLDNLKVIPNFMKIENENIDYSKREKKVIAAGRFHPDKQFDHLIKIWEKVSKKHSDWSLEIYGDGDNKIIDNLNEYIRQKNIKNVSLKESVNNLEDKLKQSSVLCLCSQTESFSMILIESKKYMLPVVSYDCPTGPKHIIKDDGILVEHNNIDKFAHELNKIIENKDLRITLAQNAYRNKDLFSSTEIIKEWNSLLN